MFGIGALHKRIDRLELILSEQRIRDLSCIHADINFIIQKLSEFEKEVKSLKQQLLKNQGKIEITVTDCKRL